MSFQDILGQLPLLKSYTHVLLCFSLPDTERDPVLDALRSATKRLVAAFPFLAGTVIHTDIGEGNSGTFTVDFDPDSNNGRINQILQIKDLASVLPPYSTIRAAHAPPSMLPGSLVAPPRPAFPQRYTDATAPVLEIQASLVSGGLLLTIAAQHNIIDATGIFYIAHLLSRLMDADAHPNPIPHADLLLGNCDRQHLTPLLPPGEPLPRELDVFTRPYPKPLDQETLSQFSWSLLHFPPESVQAIHAEGNANPADFVDGVKEVSVNDALTAFCWQRLTLVRASLRKPQSSPLSNPPLPPDELEKGVEKGVEKEEETTQLTRATDLRRPMSLTPSYMGHMVRTSNLRLPTAKVLTSSLSHLASLLRQTVSAHTTSHSIRSYATLLSRTRDKSRILYAGEFNPLTDFSCSSVAHVAMPRFGADLGSPDYVRRPTFGVLPGG
ncbi:hypothetical protein BJX99DRAFT_255425, partial [Aspergillus californicus]